MSADSQLLFTISVAGHLGLTNYVPAPTITLHYMGKFSRNTNKCSLYRQRILGLNDQY